MAEREVSMDEAAVIMRGDRAAGLLAAVEGEGGPLRAALAAAGYTVADVEDAGPDDSPSIRLDAECTAEDSQPCDVALALGVAMDVAAELRLPSHGTLRGIAESGVVSMAEARAVLRSWATEVRAAPAADEDALGWADVVESEVFGQEPGPTKGGEP